MIYIDQPIGTGFSYSSSEKDIRHDEKGVGDDLYDFLQVIWIIMWSQNPKCKKLKLKFLMNDRSSLRCTLSMWKTTST